MGENIYTLTVSGVIYPHIVFSEEEVQGIGKVGELLLSPLHASILCVCVNICIFTVKILYICRDFLYIIMEGHKDKLGPIKFSANS